MKKAINKINAYKDLLADEAVKFYCDEISDETIIGITANEPFSWKDGKKKVLNDANYEDAPWFIDLPGYDQALIKSLKVAQEE